MNTALVSASPPVASRPRNNARPETKVTIYKIQGHSKVRFKVTERSGSTTVNSTMLRDGKSTQTLIFIE